MLSPLGPAARMIGQSRNSRLTYYELVVWFLKSGTMTYYKFMVVFVKHIIQNFDSLKNFAAYSEKYQLMRNADNDIRSILRGKNVHLQRLGFVLSQFLAFV